MLMMQVSIYAYAAIIDAFLPQLSKRVFGNATGEVGDAPLAVVSAEELRERRLIALAAVSKTTSATAALPSSSSTSRASSVPREDVSKAQSNVGDVTATATTKTTTASVTTTSATTSATTTTTMPSTAGRSRLLSLEASSNASIQGSPPKTWYPTTPMLSAIAINANATAT